MNTHYKIRVYYFLPILIMVPFFMLKQLGLLPFYFATDSTLSYVLDSLLINGGKMPAHLFHPDVATLWFERIFVFPLAKWLQFISISTIQEFQASQNPFLNFADLSEFLLVIRSSYLYLACVFCYLGMLKLFESILEENPLWVQLIIISFISVFSFHYVAPIDFHSFVVRYEHPAIMWGALTFLMMVYAAQTQRKRYIVLMGVFANLAFLSKIIVLPSIILYLFLFYVLTVYYQKDNVPPSLKEKKQTVLYSSLLLLLTIFTVSFSLTAVFKYDVLSYNSQYKNLTDTHMIFLSIPFIFIVITLFILSLVLYSFKNSWNKSSYYLHRLLIFVNCMFGSTFLQLFQSNGFKLFPMSYLFSFGLGQISMSIDEVSYNNSTDRIIHNFQGSFPYLLTLIIILAVVFLLYTIIKKRSSLFPIALGFLAVPMIILINNLFLRSGGNETELGLYTIFISAALVLVLSYYVLPNKFIIILPMLVAIIIHSSSLTYKIQSFNTTSKTYHVQDYRFRPQWWYTGGYKNSDGHLYFETLQKAYHTHDNWSGAFFWARDIENTKRVLQSLADNPNKLQDSALAFIGANLPYYNETLQTISDEIKNSLVLAITNSGTIRSREDFAFYIATETELPHDKQENLEPTNYQFNGYFVYQVEGSLFYPMDKGLGVKYLIINDYMANRL